MNAIIVAGTHSGAGKTTVSLGLMDLFRRKGARVQPFKVGPDFIDPSLHALLAGRPSRNLDSFLLPSATIRRLFHRHAGACDLAVIEGVGGLFDGYSGTDARGSTAEVARILDCPVLLVVDAKASARSIAAVVKGFQVFDRRIRIAGVFLNRLANLRHMQWCRDAVERSCGLPVLGCLFGSPAIEMEERHMGLIPAAEKRFRPSWLNELRRQFDRQADAARILKCAAAGARAPLPEKEASTRPRSRVRIGIARDAAFHFYYADGLDLLADKGAELVPFSPIADERLPQDLDGLYIGGGFPECHAPALEANRPLRSEIRALARAGLPIYAECGGLMYLGESLTPYEGRAARMAGVLPYATAMTRNIAMAYLHARTRADTLLAGRGETFPGQMFHFSELRPRAPLRYAYRLSDGARTFPDGVVSGNVLASYLHLHFCSKPSLAGRFVARCRQERERRAR